MGKLFRVVFVWIPAAVILCICAAMCIGVANFSYEDIDKQAAILRIMDKR